MTKRAFFVIGPEGSGTNMLAEAFVSAGCHEDPRHRSYMDDYEFEKMPDLLMFRRSFPHQGRWPDIDEVIKQLRRAYYAVYVVAIVRDSTITHRSIIARDSNRTLSQLAMDISGFHKTFADIVEKPYVWKKIISYEGFCLDPAYRRWIFVGPFNLKEPTIEIKYANTKYYEKQE